MPRIVVILVVYIVILSFAMMWQATAAPDVKSDESMNYAERVIQADRGAGEIIAKEFLLGYEPFRDLASGGSKNIDECIRFLAAKGHSRQQRLIAILSMHNLSAKDYVSFLRKLSELFDQGAVSRDELGLAVIPSYAFSTVIIENYLQEEVQGVLKEIAARPDVRPSIKSGIDSILSGNALRDMRSFRRNCCSEPNKQ